jgi:hypothetical protein
VWLLTWLPQQDTDLHDHGGSAGVYSPALAEMTRYHLANGQLVVTAVDRTGADW